MEHIGNKIKFFIEESKLSSVEVAKQMKTSYQNLYRIFNRVSVETRYLFELSKILNIPVTSFFEDEQGIKFTSIDREKLLKENEENKIIFDKLLEYVHLDNYLTGFIEEYIYDNITFDWFKSQLEKESEFKDDLIALIEHEKSVVRKQYFYDNPEYNQVFSIPLFKLRKYDGIFLNLIFEIYDRIINDTFINLMVKRGVYKNSEIKREFIRYWNHITAKDKPPIISKAIERKLSFKLHEDIEINN